MKTPLSYLAALASAALIVLVGAPASSRGQTGASPEEITANLIVEIIAQQTVLVENQTKIDERIGQVAEEVRLARLNVARGGGVKSAQ